MKRFLLLLLFVVGCGTTSNKMLYTPENAQIPWQIRVELGRHSVEVFFNDSLVVEGGTGVFGSRTELTGNYRGMKVLAIVNHETGQMFFTDVLRCDLLINDKLVGSYER